MFKNKIHFFPFLKFQLPLILFLLILKRHELVPPAAPLFCRNTSRFSSSGSGGFMQRPASFKQKSALFCPQNPLSATQPHSTADKVFWRGLRVTWCTGCLVCSWDSRLEIILLLLSGMKTLCGVWGKKYKYIKMKSQNNPSFIARKESSSKPFQMKGFVLTFFSVNPGL